MAWHQGYCPICKQYKMVGYVGCLRLKLCTDCFEGWQNGEIEIKQAWEFSLN